MIKQLIKGSAIYGMAPFVPKLLTVLLLPILTKYLTSVDFGIIGTITSITLAVQAFQNLGLQAILSNYFYKCRCQYKIVWREIYGFLSLWMIAYALIQTILLYVFIPKEAEDNKWLIIILSNFSTVLFGPTSLIGHKYYQLNLKPSPVAVRIVLAGVTTILVYFLCVVYFGLGYLGAYVGSFAGTFLMNLSYWPLVNMRLGLSPVYSFKIKTIKHILKIGLPIIPHQYSGYLMNSTNVVAMNFYAKPQALIGHLTMSQQISGVFDGIINGINQMFSPMEYEYIRDNKPEEIRKLMLTYAIITYAMTFLYCLWSREAYQILISNDEIASTYKYSIFFVMALNYRPSYVYCCNYYIYHERTGKLLIITLVAGIISCLFYFLFIPVIGIYAALIGFYIGCLYQGYSGYHYSLYKQCALYKPCWWKFLSIQLLLTLVVYLLVDIGLVWKIPLTLGFLSLVFMFFILRVQRVCSHNLQVLRKG